MKKIEHIGIAVKDLDIAIPLYEQLLNMFSYKKGRLKKQEIQNGHF